LQLKILVVDDEKAVRSALSRLLRTQPGWEIVGEASGGSEAIGKARDLQPDVVILDISMPDMNGLEAAPQIKKAHPATEVLIFTQHESEFLVREAQSAGARGYLLKSDAHRLVAAVQTVGQHKEYFAKRNPE
jgi:DNA-binding NarL/FixJ family response regulator